MANVSKNAKVNRGSKTKSVIVYNGKEVEICPAMFIGKSDGKSNYIAVQNKATKELLLDQLGLPLRWKTSNILSKPI